MLPAATFDIDLYNELIKGVRLAPANLVVPTYDEPIDAPITRTYERSEMTQQLSAAIKNFIVRKWPTGFKKMLRVAMQDCIVSDNKIYYRSCLWMKIQVIYRIHSSGPAGRPGRTNTIDLISRTYWCPQMHQEIAAYVQACELCIRTKCSKSAPSNFLRPLQVPFRAWSDISIDYITLLPTCTYYDCTQTHFSRSMQTKK